MTRYLVCEFRQFKHREVSGFASGGALVGVWGAGWWFVVYLDFFILGLFCLGMTRMFILFGRG